MVIIVVGVGATRGWRSTIVGAISGLTVLAGIVIGLGTALRLIPIDPLRVVIGALLLTFGLQWLRKGVIGVAADGFFGGEEDDEEGAARAGRGAGLLDWTAWLLAFKGVVLEGLEIAFIVIAFGAGAGTGSIGYFQAYVGAGAAFVVIGALGVMATGRLQQVPGRVLKFAVGGLLSTFGTFWAMEGLGVHWPGGRLSLAWLYAIYLATTFVLAALASRGLLGPRPIPSALGDTGPAGPLEVAPASSASITRYQRLRQIEPTGVLGAPTQAAMRAERAERRMDPGDLDAVGVDPADPDAVTAFQRQHGLPETGVVDAMTQGALRVAQVPGALDGHDPDNIRRFQREHELTPTGQLDAGTTAAWRAIIAESAHSTDDGDNPGLVDPITAYCRLDPRSGRSVRQLQRSLHLHDDGVIAGSTRGAILALRARLGWSGEDADGGMLWGGGGNSNQPDPADAAQIKAFQRSYGLPADGRVDEATRCALRWEYEHLLGVDVSSPESVRTFQRRHGLYEDGIVGPRAQAAMRAVRRTRQQGDGRLDPAKRYGDARAHAAGFGLGLDPVDAGSVRHFQRSHGLADDGVIGPRTQAALRALRAQHAGSIGEVK